MERQMQALSDVTAIILAGGLGTRLHSVFPQRPKVLAEVRGRPFLAYLLDQMASWDIRKVVLCTGYLGEQITRCFHDSYKNLRLVYSREESPLGTAGALRKAWPLLDSDSGLILNGDSYCRADLGSFWIWHCRQGGEMTLMLIESSDTERYGKVETDEEGRILRFDEKPPEGGKGWINAGVYACGSRFVQSIPERYPISLERDIFPSWMSGGLYGYKTPGQFLDIGTPESYRLAEKFFTEEMVE